jgi:hypothetical protein
MDKRHSYWSIIYGKAVFNTSLVKAVSRGLLPSLRAACVVSPSPQNLSVLSLLEKSLTPTSPSPFETPKKRSRCSNDDSAVTSAPDVLPDACVMKVSFSSFVEQVAAWTDDEKTKQIELLKRADVILKREKLAEELKFTDFDLLDDDDKRWDECESSDSHDDDDCDGAEDAFEDAFEEFKVMMKKLSAVFRGEVSKGICYKVESNCDEWASVIDCCILTVDDKMVRGSTKEGHERRMSGTSAFKFRPGFFDVSPFLVRSLKFVSNLLGLDDSATVRGLQDYDQPSPKGRYGSGSSKAGRVTSEQMNGSDPAWFTLQTVSGCL